MKFTQKIKYFVFGVVTVAVLIPLSIKAYDAITLQFNTGDIVSANVFNSLFSRLNDVQMGFKSSTEIVGTWACTTYSSRTGCPSSFVSTGGGVLTARTQNITFSCSGGICSYTASTFFPATCSPSATSYFTSQYEVTGNIMAISGGYSGIYGIQKLSPTKFVWQINASLPQQEYTICELANSPPAPINNLVASVSNSTISLTWSSLTSTQTGIKIQRTASALNPWVTIATTTASATSYTDYVSFTGSYLYRAISTNSYGDSISSSEVAATVTNVVANGSSGASGSGSGSF